MRSFWCSLLLLVAQSQAQSSDSRADSLASEAASLFTLVAGEGYSIYTEITALIGAAGSAAEPTSTDASPQSVSSTASASSQLTSTPTSASRTANPSSRTRTRSTRQTSSTPSTAARTSSFTTSRRLSSFTSPTLSSTLAAAAASSTTNGELRLPDNDSGHALAAILVGSILGAAVLGLLLLVAVLCMRRRRRGSDRSGGVTPTSDEIRSWRNTHGTTSYAPLTEFGTEGNLQSEKAAAAVNVRSVEDGHDCEGHRDSKMHPAYRNVDMRELVRDRTHSALTKEVGIDDIDATVVGALPPERRSQHKRNSIPRKPVPVAVSAGAAGVFKDRNGVNGKHSHEEDHLVSPVSPLLHDVIPLGSSQAPRHIRNDSRDALLADTDNPGTDRDRPSFDRDDSFTAALPQPLRPRQSTYTAYQPGVSASPYGPSPTHPAAAVIAAYRNQDRDAPGVPPRSPKRRSYGYNSSGGSSTESVDEHHRRRQSVDAQNDDSPMLRQRSADSPRMPPKGVTFHDFVPVKRSPRSSGAPAAAWGAVRYQDGAGRRASLDAYESRHDHRSDREGENALRPTRSAYAVGQAM